MKDYPFRVSFILRQGTWWVVERAQDLRVENKPCYLEEEAEVLVTMFLPEKASYKVDSLSQLTPELVDQLLEHFVDPVNGSPSKGRKSVGVLSLHVDDLIISGTPQFLKWFLEKIKKHFTVGHEDVNDLMFTGQRVRWVFDEQKRKRYFSIDQNLVFLSWKKSSYPNTSRTLTSVTSSSTHHTDLCWEVLTDYNPEHSSRLVTVFAGWRRPQLLQLLVTARSLTSFADRSGTMKSRCVCGL